MPHLPSLILFIAFHLALSSACCDDFTIYDLSDIRYYMAMTVSVVLVAITENRFNRKVGTQASAKKILSSILLNWEAGWRHIKGTSWEESHPKVRADPRCFAFFPSGIAYCQIKLKFWVIWWNNLYLHSWSTLELINWRMEGALRRQLIRILSINTK